MKKITTIFLAAFLIGACTDSQTPVEALSKNSFPQTITMSKDPFFIKDSTLQGSIPLSINPASFPSGYGQIMSYILTEIDSSTNPNKKHTLDITTVPIQIAGQKIKGSMFDSIPLIGIKGDLFTVGNVNYKNQKIFGNIITGFVKNKNGFTYAIGKPNLVNPDKLEGFLALYEQTGPKTFNRICYVRTDSSGNIIEHDPTDGVGAMYC